jgi:hypothetical protein
VTDQQPASLPSPAATTSSSESTTKRHCSEDSWTYFIADEQTAQPEFNEASEALQSIDMGNHRSSSVESEVEFYVPGGLQTPDLSPPNVTRYLSPANHDLFRETLRYRPTRLSSNEQQAQHLWLERQISPSLKTKRPFASSF